MRQYTLLSILFVFVLSTGCNKQEKPMLSKAEEYIDNNNVVALENVLEDEPSLLNLKSNTNDTLLHYAVYYNNDEKIIKTLLDKGVDVNAINNAGDTALQIPAAAARVALTVSGGVASANTLTFDAIFPADTPDVTAPATTPVTEAGLFNDVTAGDMLAHTVFAVVNKGEADTMTISWVVTIS